MKVTPKRIDARKDSMERAQQARVDSKELRSIHEFFMNPRWFPVNGFRFSRTSGARYQTDKYGNRERVVT